MLSVGAIHPPFTVGVPVVSTVTVGAFGVFGGLVVGGARSVCCVVAFAAEKAVAAYPPPTTSKTISAANTNDLLARCFIVARPSLKHSGLIKEFEALALAGYQCLVEK